MKVRVTFEFTETELKALADHYGDKKITKNDVRTWIGMTVTATLETIVSEYEDNDD